MEKSKTVLVQNWEESERGWGVRPDGFTIHLDKDQHTKYVTWYNQKFNNEPTAHDSYTRISGDPIEVEVDDVIFGRIEKAMKDFHEGRHPVYALRGRGECFSTSPMRSLKESDIIFPITAKSIELSYIGKVDASDIGHRVLRRVFKLSDILSDQEIRSFTELELSVELVLGTNGQLDAKVRLSKHE